MFLTFYRLPQTAMTSLRPRPSVGARRLPMMMMMIMTRKRTSRSPRKPERLGLQRLKRTAVRRNLLLSQPVAARLQRPRTTAKTTMRLPLLPPSSEVAERQLRMSRMNPMPRRNRHLPRRDERLPPRRLLPQRKTSLSKTRRRKRSQHQRANPVEVALPPRLKQLSRKPNTGLVVYLP